MFSPDDVFVKSTKAGSSDNKFKIVLPKKENESMKESKVANSLRNSSPSTGVSGDTASTVNDSQTSSFKSTKKSGLDKNPNKKSSSKSLKDKGNFT